MNGIHSASSAQFMSTQARKLDNMKNPSTQQDSELKQAAADFEALFVNQMLSTMRDSVGESDLLPSQEGEKVFRSMLDQEFAQKAANSGTLGLGEIVYKDLKPIMGD